MKKTLSTMAAAAVLMASTALAPAMAQTSDPATPAPATPATPSTEMPAATPTPDASSNDSVAAPAGEPAAGTGAASGAYITEQSETQVSVNDYIGKVVYNAENASVGNITDLILEEDGGIVAAIIGVGGFLGIGQKDVAVPIDNITITRDASDNNEVRLTTTETVESLKAAPEFKTLDDQQAESDAAAVPPAAGSATVPDSTTTPSTTEPAN